jgi:hypothetical protein
MFKLRLPAASSSRRAFSFAAWFAGLGLLFIVLDSLVGDGLAIPGFVFGVLACYWACVGWLARKAGG